MVILANNNDLRLKITAQLDENQSTKAIQDQLDKISKRLKINVGIDTKQLKDIQKTINQMQSQANKKGKGLQIADDNEIKNGKQLFKTLDDAVRKYSEIGKVKVNKIFDPMTQELKGFNLELQRTSGLIDKMKFESAKLKGMHGVDGFVMSGRQQVDNRSIEAEKALTRTIENRQKEERRAAEAQAKAINKNLEQKQREIQRQDELNKQIQKEIELYQRSKQIQSNDLKRRYGDNINSTALNNQMSQVMAIDPRAITSMQQFRSIQRDIDLGFREIQTSARSSSSHVTSFGEAFRTAMVRLCRLV